MNGYDQIKYKFKKLGTVVTGGFAIFAMFFGAGNLIFPLLAGKTANNNFLLAFTGLCLTGILVPFLGLLGILLYNGCYKEFFGQFGKKTSFILIMVMLLLLGPLGVLPRCITVAYGGFSVLNPTYSLTSFSLFLCGIVFLLCINRTQIVPVLGAILAPAKILSLGFILLFGLLSAATPQQGPMTSSQALHDGILKGYQMMDLIAAFFFATVITRHFKEKFTQDQNAKNSPFNLSLLAMLLGSGLLFIVYFALIYLGATFSEILNGKDPEQFLSIIAYVTLGKFAGYLVTIAIILSCLTTIVALTTVFTDFLYEQIFKERFQHLTCLTLTIAGTFLISNLGFGGIMALLSPILFYLYPFLIFLTIINISAWAWKKKLIRKF